MLIGKYYYCLQPNQRLSLPKVFRQESDQWIITRGLDGCLFIFKEATFEQEIAQVAARSFTKKTHRDLLRLMTNEATLVTADRNGRVHLPQYLIDLAHLTKQIVIVGSFNYLEVWDQDRYHQYCDQLSTRAEEIAEQVDVRD